MCYHIYMQEGTQRTVKDAVAQFNRDELENQVAALAAKLGMAYVDARQIELLPDTLSLVGKYEAQKGVLPLTKKAKELTLGLAEPNSPFAQEKIDYFNKFFNVTPVVISWEAIKEALPEFEGLKKQELAPEPSYEVEAYEIPLTFADLEQKLNDSPLQDILKYIVGVAIESKSSDIHLEPEKEGARIRFRMDGVLHIVGKLNADRFKYVLSQIELASGMKLNVDEAQEGRLEVKLAGQNISVRVETMPTLYGDDISLRIFNTAATMLTVTDLGLADYDKSILEQALARPQGMILVVGPTGAGKTSTIYAVLNVLNKPEVKIITLEDPIEYALPGITQSQIHEDESFTDRLKAVLREDPDIVMVGEIRDTETTDVALHAALTGHVMISTFHANDTSTALGLLKELSTEKTLLSSAINLVVAQRLVRRLCDKCKKPHTLTATEKTFADSCWDKIPEEIKGSKKLEFFEPTGCEECNGLGYQGRIGIFEMMPMNLDLQKIIAREDVTVAEIKEAASANGMVTMEQDGLLKAIGGVTAISEIMKAIRE